MSSSASASTVTDKAPVAGKVYFPLLDVLRGPAAILVFMEHWRNLFFKDFDQVDQPTIATKVIYLLTGAGHEAVMIFFALSGCVIAHVVQSMKEKGYWSWSSYLTARVTRLWVVLIPALVLTACWDTLGIATSKADSIYVGSGFGHVVNASVSETSRPMDFVGNMFFLQTIYVPTFGSNGPLWSIAYEFVYYLAYPALLLAGFSTIRGHAKFGYVVLTLCILLVAGASIALSFPIWLGGVVAYWCYKWRAVSERTAIIGFLIMALATFCAVAFSRLPVASGVPGKDYLIGMVTSFTLYFGLAVPSSRYVERLARPFQALSAISYSLYLLHMPILVFLASRFFQHNGDRWNPDLKHLAIGALIAILVFIYCIVIWSATEKQTGVVRSWIKRYVTPAIIGNKKKLKVS